PAMTQLQDARVLLQMLLDQLPEGIAIAYGPPDFPIIASSRRLEELTGFRPHDLVGMAAGQGMDNRRWFLIDGVPSSGLDQHPLYRASRCGETIRNEELVVVWPDGT